MYSPCMHVYVCMLLNVHATYVGCGIRFSTPSINGHQISARKDSFLLIVGVYVHVWSRSMEHCAQCKAVIRCFSQELFVEICTVWKHENGRKSSVSRRWLLHCKMKRSVCYYFVAIWVHSHSAHSQGFEQSFLAMGEHGFVEPEVLGSSIIGCFNAQCNSCISKLRPVMRPFLVYLTASVLFEL